MLNVDCSPYLAAKRWLLAYSGGLDSSVLLHLLAYIPQRPDITAVYIHHGLQAEADLWQQHCQQQAQCYGVDFMAIKVDVSRQGSLENNARDARYQAFASLIKQGDVLFMAHHATDQLETLLFRLARGTGLRGLAGIPMQRALAAGQIVRPLLNRYSRADLEAYAQHYQLSYVEDPSNAESAYDRNYLRNQVLPVLQQRWPQAAQAAGQTAEYLTQSQALLDEIANEDVAKLSTIRWWMPCLDISALQQLSPLRQTNSLHYWFRQQGVYLDTAQFQQLKLWFDNANTRASMRLRSTVLRYEQGTLYVDAHNREHTIQPQLWNTQEPLLLSGIGQYILQPALDMQLEVRPRTGGEKICIQENRPRQTLKAVFQQHQLPSFVRDQIPLFYYQNELIAVGDFVTTVKGKQLLPKARLYCLLGE